MSPKKAILHPELHSATASISMTEMLPQEIEVQPEAVYSNRTDTNLTLRDNHKKQPPAIDLISFNTKGVTGKSICFHPLSSQAKENLSHDLPHNKSNSVKRWEPCPGATFRNYELLRILGEGGMGCVYLARDNKLGRKVAIKFLTAELEPKAVERFIVESRVTAGLCGHESIVTIHEVDEIDGRPYMVLEYIDGQNLKQLAGGQPMPPSRAVKIIVSILKGLSFAHNQGIVHRDIKPENILVTESGEKILDFGIAKRQRVEPRQLPLQAPLDSELADALTNNSLLLGTPAYMPPEQWQGLSETDQQSDLWSIGIVLFGLLTGTHPLGDLKGMQFAVVSQLDKPMPSLENFAPLLPKGLIQAVDWCLKKKKSERVPDAITLLRALEPYLPGKATREIKLDESPFAGLVPFQESDASRFYGREKELATAMSRLADQSMMAIVGPSGIGKSSFLRGGLAHRIKHSGERWEVFTIRPGISPLSNLTYALWSMTGITSCTVAGDLQEEQKIVSRLKTEPGFAGSIVRKYAKQQNCKILFLVDQFEELFTHSDQEQRSAFSACLCSIADDPVSPVRMAIALRTDYLDKLAAESPLLLEEISKNGLFFLGSLTPEGLRQALEQPADAAGYQFENGIVEDMIAHLQVTPGALPFLGFTASQLWRERDPSRKMLTLSSYQYMGGISGALSRHADQVLNELSLKNQKLVQNIFLRLITPERTRAIVPVEDLEGLSASKSNFSQVLEKLVQSRLLVIQTNAGYRTVEIVHECLISGWNTLLQWLEKNSEDTIFIEQLRTSARQWQANKRDNGLLWRGEIVDEASRFEKRYRGELTDLEKSFLEAVLAEKSKTARRRHFYLVAGIVFLATLAITAAIVAIITIAAQRKAVEQAGVAMRAKEIAKKAEATALLQAGMAKKAETEARKNLEKVQHKEHERALAAKQAQDMSLQLQEKNKELLDALKRTEIARRIANENSRKAKEAREEALVAAQRLEVTLQQEKERVRRLQEQFGSPLFEEIED